MAITLFVPATETAPELVLRPWRVDDVPVVVGAYRDAGLRTWLTRRITDEGEAWRWVDEQAEGWRTRTRFGFAVVVGSDERPAVGHVVVKVAAGGVGEVGYWTVAEARGRGVAGRALETVSRWALGVQKLVPLRRLDLLHAEDNLASCRVAEKGGYVLAELLPPAPPAFPGAGHRHVRTAA